MKRIFEAAVLVVLVTAVPCRALDQAKPPKLSEEEVAERNKSIQLTLDRLVHRGAQFSMVGPIEKGKGDQYLINGEPFIINSATKVQGKIRTGQSAEVRGFLRPGKAKIAEQVVMIEAPPGARSSSVEVEPNLSSGPPKNLR